MKTLVLMLACLCAACTTAPAPATVSTSTVETTPSEVRLTDADAGVPAVVAKGGDVTVTLAGNPTTGYAWTLLSGNASVLKPAGDPVYSAGATSVGMVGSGGAFIFKFRAVDTGNATLTFAYRRSWEKDAVLLKTFVVTVRGQ